METTIRINTDSIIPEPKISEANSLKELKKFFPHKNVEITIQPADETDNILSNPVFTQVLEERIAAYEEKKQVVALKSDDLL